MGIPEHLTYLLRKLYVGQEATARTWHETMDWLQIGKWVHQGCILSPCLFNLHAVYIMRNARLNETQAGIKIAGRSINNLRYADDTTHGRKQRGTEEPLDESERGEWKNWLKTQHSQNEGQGIWSYHVMANRWGNSDKTLFWGVPKSLQMATEAMKLKGAWSLEEKLWKT